MITAAASSTIYNNHFAAVVDVNLGQVRIALVNGQECVTTTVVAYATNLNGIDPTAPWAGQIAGTMPYSQAAGSNFLPSALSWTCN